MTARKFQQFVVCLCLSVAVLAPAKQVEAQQQSFIEIPLESLNNEQPIEFRGLISSQTLTVRVPQSWVPGEENWLEAQISVSPLLDLKRSSFTISLNNQPILSYTAADISALRQRIRIPGTILTQGNNSLTFTGTLYLPDDLQTNCQNWEDPARWLTILPGGILHLSFAKRDLPPDLANFPDVLFEPLEKYLPDHAKNQVLVVLPENSTSDDLGSLSAISYILGSHATVNGDWRPEIVTQAQFNVSLAANRNVIFVGSAPPEFQGQVSKDKDYVGVFSSPWGIGNTVLVLGDQNRQDGFSPATIFSDRARTVLLRGNLAYVDHPASAPALPFPNKFSFEDLGYLDRTVRGIGQQNLVYSLYIPYDLQPLLVKLNLGLVHSPDLDLQNSSFTIYLNGFSVAGIRPSGQASAAAPIPVGLPAKKFRPGTNFIRINFNQHLPRSSCERMLESVWSTVLNSSTLEITYRNQTPIPSLKHFPLPFSGDPEPIFVIPDQFNQADLQHVSRLSFLLGAAAYEASNPPETMTATNFEQNKTNYRNVILVGLPSQNPVIRRANDVLPQPFRLGADSLKDGYGVYLPTSDQDASLGLMQILPSPWVKAGTVLVLTGNDRQGLDWAWDVVLNPALQNGFAGNLMVIGSGNRSATLGQLAGQEAPQALFQQVADASNIPVIGSILQRNGDSFRTTGLIAIGLALLLVLGMLASIRTIRNRNVPKLIKGEDEEQL